VLHAADVVDRTFGVHDLERAGFGLGLGAFVANGLDVARVELAVGRGAPDQAFGFAGGHAAHGVDDPGEVVGADVHSGPGGGEVRHDLLHRPLELGGVRGGFDPRERQVGEVVGDVVAAAGDHDRLALPGGLRDLLDPSQHERIGQQPLPVLEHECAGIGQRLNERQRLVRIDGVVLLLVAHPREAPRRRPGPGRRSDGVRRRAQQDQEPRLVSRLHDQQRVARREERTEVGGGVHRPEQYAAPMRRSDGASLATWPRNGPRAVRWDTGMDEFAELPEMRTVDLDGPVAYREWGSGGDGRPTFVCVHGLGGSHLNWMGVAPGLARTGRVLALDLIGFGYTPRAGRSSSMSSNRQLLDRFVREMADRPVILVGNSMGGALSVLQAAYEPRSVDGLVLTSPALPWARGGMPSALVLAAFAMYRMPRFGEWFVRSRSSRLGPEKLIEEGFKIVMADPSKVDPALVAAHVETARMHASDPDAIPAFLEATRSMLRTGEQRAFVEELMERISVPVLVIHGQKDRLVNVALARRAVGGRPRWTLAEFENVGHAAQMEAPDRWVSTVEDWLSSTGIARSTDRADAV
jgi:pimeloyl-ACP methyl ester carboxylesterase